jgi:hypothetical protein
VNDRTEMPGTMQIYSNGVETKTKRLSGSSPRFLGVLVSMTVYKTCDLICLEVCILAPGKSLDSVNSKCGVMGLSG